MESLAVRRRAHIGDLARSVLLLFPSSAIEQIPDPGAPLPSDREDVTIKTGRHAGKIWKRKPRLQLRLPGKYKAESVRKTLALALALDNGDFSLTLERSNAKMADRVGALETRIERAKEIVDIIGFQLMPEGCKSTEDALYVLGVPPKEKKSETLIRKRFRKLAAIYHPDADFGDHERMSQLNVAMSLLTPRRRK